MLNRSASLAMSTSVLKALPGKLDIKRHSSSILYLSLLPLFVFVWFLFCYVVLGVLPSYAIKRVDCFTLIVFCLCFVSLPRGAVGWSVVCDCVPFPGNTHLSRGMRFPTMWHFDKC